MAAYYNVYFEQWCMRLLPYHNVQTIRQSFDRTRDASLRHIRISLPAISSIPSAWTYVHCATSLMTFRQYAPLQISNGCIHPMSVGDMEHRSFRQHSLSKVEWLPSCWSRLQHFAPACIGSSTTTCNSESSYYVLYMQFWLWSNCGFVNRWIGRRSWLRH